MLLGAKAAAVDDITMMYVGGIAAAMANLRQWEPDEWVKLVSGCCRQRGYACLL